MKRIVLILCILFAFTSCENDDLPQSNVEFSSVAKGDSFPNDESVAQRHLVIKDSKTWNSLIAEINSVQNLSSDFKETNIDFSKYQLIAVIAKPQSDAGHSIDIVQIDENRNTIIVKVEKLLNGNVTLALARPYDIVKILKTDKKIIFEQ